MRTILTGALCAMIIGCLILASSASKAGLGDYVDFGWSDAELIETNIERAFNPQVAVDGSGNATVVWYQWDGTRYNIWSNRYVVGDGWGDAELIETNDMGGAGLPQVAVDGSGNVTAVWSQHDGLRENIWSNRYVVGTGWGVATLIETDDTGDAAYPQVAVDGSGNATAVWYQWDGTRYNIYSNRYVVGTGWGDAELIETNDMGGAGYPQAAVDGSGNVTAVWYQYDGTRNSIYSNRYVVGTGWGTAQLIEIDSGDAGFPQVAIDGSDNAIAVWQQYDGARFNIWSNRYVIGTGWGTATLIETDDTGRAEDPQVAVDGSGNATAVWHQSDGTRYNIYSNRYVIGTGWGDATLIETDDTGDAAYPQVAVDGSGNATAVWYQWDGTRYNIWSNRYVKPDITPPSLSLDSPSDGLTTETPVVTASGTTEPGAALSINGILVAVESDGSFSCTIALVEGINTVAATATDASDNSATVSVSVTYINPVHEIEEELDDALDELVDIQDELNTTQNDLDAVGDELDAIKNDLNATQDDLDAVEAELDATEEELRSTSDDLSDVRSQNLVLMAVLVVFAILAVVMSVMFFSLRRKIADASGKPAEEEEPPPPQS